MRLILDRIRVRGLGTDRPPAWLALLCFHIAVSQSGCAPASSPASVGTRPAVDTVVVVDSTRLEVLARRSAELEQQLALLQLQLLARDARVAQLQDDLDEARREVVRAMARWQTMASRAEAASGMAEAEIALESLREMAGSERSTEIGEAERLLVESTTEFNNSNYAGALYLANQARSLAGAAEARVFVGSQPRRAGEVPFEVSVPLRVTTRSNVREGPGREFRVLFTLDEGSLLTGHSYTDEWVRVTDETGREGWIFQMLVGSRQPVRR